MGLAIRVARSARRWGSGIRRRARRWLAAAVAGTSMAGVPAVLIDARSVGQIDPLPMLVADDGIRFGCRNDDRQLARVRADMHAYLAQLAIPASWIRERVRDGDAVFTLNTAPDDTLTLDFVRREGMDLRDEIVRLPGARGRMREVHTVARKEIVLALLQHGRRTRLPCRVESLRERVGVRQNIVAWAETLDWLWPNGGRAQWNRSYWHRGTPSPRYPLHEAVNDAFMHPSRYRIGCYTATKLALLQGVLDYYGRVQPDAAKLRRIEARLMADGEPLVGFEPGAMWFFEDGYSVADALRPGKLVDLQRGVAPGNFVPADWLYLLNTDARSGAKTGYEGSNAIYLGRNRFDDYYDDNHHSFSFREKVAEVYQWRNGVFARHRDGAKAKPLTDADFEVLGRTPEAGGLLEDYRAVVALDAIDAS